MKNSLEAKELRFEKIYKIDRMMDRIDWGTVQVKQKHFENEMNFDGPALKIVV